MRLSWVTITVVVPRSSVDMQNAPGTGLAEVDLRNVEQRVDLCGHLDEPRVRGLERG